MRPSKHAVGFRVKSGWAVAVLMTATGNSTQLLDRQVLELSDPSIPDTRQPHHVIESLSGAAAEKEIERLRKIVFRIGTKAVSDFLMGHGKSGFKLMGAGIVVGSDIDPAKIGNLHVRAHALEGRLFRSVVEDATKHFGLPFVVVTEKQIYASAEKALRIPEAEIKNHVKRAGESFDGPWRSEEKTAFLAAWMTLV
jgi:hypothetical protein